MTPGRGGDTTRESALTPAVAPTPRTLTGLRRTHADFPQRTRHQTTHRCPTYPYGPRPGHRPARRLRRRPDADVRARRRPAPFPGRPATASSTENGSFPATAAVDGNPDTRWSSAFADPQWVQVDLGSVQQITRVTLNWEAAYAKAYQIQTSTDANNWTTVYSTTTATGGTQNLGVTGSGRYVRVSGTVRATLYGYSLWEFQVYGPGSTTPPDSFWGSTSDIPPASNAVEVKILNRTNGKYPDSQVYWSFNGQVHSIAEQPYLDMLG